MIDLKVVKTKDDLSKFIKLPWKIYKDDMYWVPPLIAEVEELLNRDKNPFWKHADRELFLALKDKEVIGRIAAVIDDNHNNFHNEKTGFFGFFECINDSEVADILLNNAKEWCKSKGMNLLRGPISPSTNDEWGLLIEGFDSSPVIMMPYNPEYYRDLLERYGLKKAKDLFAFIKKAGVPERIAKLVQRVKRKHNVTVRQIDMKHFDRDVQIIKDIYNSAWEKNYGFVPMTEDEMNLMAKKLKPMAIPPLILFAEINGEPVGSSITIPDYNQILKKLNGKLNLIGILKYLYYKNKVDGTRSIVFGIKKEHRSTGINTVLYYETEMAGLKLGYKWCELSWNLEDNDLINKFDEAVGGKLYKKYRVFEVSI